MRLSANKASPDYHNVVHFVAKILLDGVELPSCIDVDTKAGTVECMSLPVHSVDGVHVVTHTVRGNVEIVWRELQKPSENGLIGNNTVFLHLKKEWEERERARMAREQL